MTISRRMILYSALRNNHFFSSSRDRLLQEIDKRPAIKVFDIQFENVIVIMIL
jgi:hypothetical protein